MTWNIWLELLCFVARRAIKSLERSGQTRFKLLISGTSWHLSLVRKPSVAVPRRKRLPVSTLGAPTTSGVPIASSPDPDGSERATETTDSNEAYSGHSASLHLLG